jgi:SNF2 family DNA or RNA helicase
MEYFVKPWGHQGKAIEQAKDLPDYGLFFDMGAGKTMTAINIARHKFAFHQRTLRTAIFGPPIVVENWRREWLMHSKVPASKLVPLIGSQVERVKTFKKAAASGEGVIFITNYEALLMKDLYALLLEWKPELLIWDELHKLKDIKSKRTKAAIPLADAAVYRLGLTGTPILNSTLDLFAQFRILDTGRQFGKNFFAFRAKYFIDKNAGMPQGKYFPDWRPRESMFEEMNNKIYQSAMRVKKEDCMDLPPLVRKPIYIDMTPKQKLAYDQMRKAYIAYINDKAAVAELAITKALRLQQIVSGFVKMDDGTITRFADHPRRIALKELLEELTPNHKVIIWSVFKENYIDIREVCEELKIQYVEVNGEKTNAEKNANVDVFNNSPDCRVLSGHPGSGGIGINLVVSDVSIFYSRNFSLEQDLQAEARNYRGGSERHSHVTRIDLVATGTIDEVVVEKLSGKIAIGEKVLKEIICGTGPT